MERDVEFASMPVSLPLLFSSGCVLLVAMYYTPLSLLASGVSLRDLQMEDNWQKYMIRSVLIAYIPALVLSLVVHHHKSRSHNLLYRVVRVARSLIALLELAALAVYSAVTPAENSALHDSGVKWLVVFFSCNIVVTLPLVVFCVPGTRCKPLSFFLKLAVLAGVSLVTHAPLCPGGQCSQALVLPLYALFHGSGVCDVGDKRIVIRHIDVGEFERNVVRTRQELMRRDMKHDLETQDL